MTSTLISIHVLPHEFSMFEEWISQYRASLALLSKENHLVLRASLNLNPLLVDWENSLLKQDHFIRKFNEVTRGILNINEVVDDTSLLGTTQQRRESIMLDYDQFIFADSDISYPASLLRSLLDASYTLAGKFIFTPQIVRIWDKTWDPIVHSDFIECDHTYHLRHDPMVTYNQKVGPVTVRSLGAIRKFSGGWFTLYSKELMDFVGIPESLGGYGAEDCFIGYASDIAAENGIILSQYVLEGLYISENYLKRDSTYGGRVKLFAVKDQYRRQAEIALVPELEKFAFRITGKKIFCTLHSYLP